MSFKRLESEDFLISTDAIVAPAFAGGSSNNTNGTAVNSGVSANYFKAYNGTDGRGELAVAFGDKTGPVSGSQAVYKQFANLIQGSADSDLAVGTSFVAVVIDRQRYKQSILPSTFRINDQVSTETAAAPKFVATGSTDVVFTDAGRQFSNGKTGVAGALFLYPDIGTALINGGSLPTNIAAADVTADSEEVITSNYVFIRARNAEFNYSQNPTFIDSTTGGVRYTDFITAPQTFITTVGLYNDNGDLLAVAKLSKPLKKDFTKEALIRIKLDF